ncbi:MAG: peptide chain release factor N(5)-glutamine methyltransferase, partial [Pseudomonadota bacterium]
MLKNDLPDLDARWIIEARTGFDFSDLIARGDEKISNEILALVQNDLDQRLSGKPLSKIYREKEFFGRTFKVSEDTLDPRPDTEVLIEKVLKRFKSNPPKTILDLGAGTGCILITLLKELPNTTGVGVDVSIAALEIAKQNAKIHDVDERLKFLQSDWFENVEGSFDLIVSNPPYIDANVIPNLEKEVRNHDPILALDGGKDGLDAYRQIFSQTFLHLNPGGKLFVEIGYDQ